MKTSALDFVWRARPSGNPNHPLGSISWVITCGSDEWWDDDANGPGEGGAWVDGGGCGYFIARTSDTSDGCDSYETAARIVACVNALSGIADPAAFVEAAKEVVKAFEGTGPMRPSLLALANAAKVKP